MKKKGFDRKKGIMLVLPAILCLMLAGILYFTMRHMIDGLTEQQMAKRWSKEGESAQISCFFSQNAGITAERLEEFEHELDAYLIENSIEVSAEHPGARLWADSYSADGKITLSNGKISVEADAVGFGGDFFLFHPQKLLYGSYFSGHDINQDYCVIDQDAAWQLFGSNNVAGMTVYISGLPYLVQGVVERPKGRLEEAAGLDGTRVFVAYSTLAQYGTVHGIDQYEIVMTNPVEKFAYNYVKKQLGQNERETEVIENSTRFSLLNRLRMIKAFGTRSMNGKAIIYPYWENLARGCEDLAALFTLLMILLLLYPIMLAVVLFVAFWKGKGWTFRDIWIKIIDRVERYSEKRYAQKHDQKQGKERK
ncbi:MAG: ABC transporter permease [Lachnospiraceae bacterium]|nr:ABC transporter permease [Lachnospiraceae bacterium]